MTTSNFTPSELKYVAETTMPAPCDLPWYIHEDGTIERESWTQSGFMQWNPEDDDTQFRGLIEWCDYRGISVMRNGNGKYVAVKIDSCWLCGIIPNSTNEYETSTDCRIAAVLAQKQSSESGEDK